jgi:hypothetical protein
MIIGKHLSVTLTPSEMQQAALIGAARQIESLRAGLKDAHGFKGTGWSEHIEGACGELAYAKVANRYWPGGVNTFKDADLLDHVQIRTRSGGVCVDLIVRNGDADNDIYVLVVGKAPDYIVEGWTIGSIAKQRKYLQSYGGRPPAYFMPDADLMPFPIKLAGPPVDTF